MSKQRYIILFIILEKNINLSFIIDWACLGLGSAGLGIKTEGRHRDNTILYINHTSVFSLHTIYDSLHSCLPWYW